MYLQDDMAAQKRLGSGLEIGVPRDLWTVPGIVDSDILQGIL